MPFRIHWVSRCHGDEEERVFATPVGYLTVKRRGAVIIGIDWRVDVASGDAESIKQDPLGSYWYDRDAVVDLTLLRRGSVFVQKIQDALLDIPFGVTISYKALADRVGSSSRAVGGACRRNDYPLIVPCHRVVSVAGPGGYSGQRQGDLLAIKLRLLAFEASVKA
ncbi:MAG: methylated-DNA--[protein]-cysteine S-methyltransferase [Methylomicrobium sp.]